MKFKTKDIKSVDSFEDWRYEDYFRPVGNQAIKINNNAITYIGMRAMEVLHILTPLDHDWKTTNKRNWFCDKVIGKFTVTKSIYKTWRELSLSEEKIRALENLKNIQRSIEQWILR